MGTREPVGLLLVNYDCIDSRGAQQARISNDRRHKLVSLDSLLCLLTAGLCLSLFRCLGSCVSLAPTLPGQPHYPHFNLLALVEDGFKL